MPTGSNQPVFRIPMPPDSNPTNTIFGSIWDEDEDITPKYNNPLTTPCSQDNAEGQIIPSLMYKPPGIPQKPKIIMPQILGQTSAIPQKPKIIVPEILGKTIEKSSSFQCDVCLRNFTRKHDLKRHLKSHLVHRNLESTPSEIIEPVPQVLPDGDEVMQNNLDIEPTKQFDDWTRETRSGRTYMDTARPTILGKRKAKVAKLGNLRIPSKYRQTEPEDSDIPDYDSWVF